VAVRVGSAITEAGRRLGTLADVPARRVNPAAVADGVLAQARAVGDWLDSLTDDEFAAATLLPGWRVAHLVTHLSQTVQTVLDVAAQLTSEPPISVADYLSRLPAAATEIDRREQANADGIDRVSATASYASRLEAVADLLAAGPTASVVVAPRGPIRLVDFLTTRAIELVTHSDDLNRALPARPVRLARPALSITCRALAEALAEQAPGQSVELRIPPFAAVQCVPGPRHTRGTPPTVVETDPVTWVRLATGRTTFAEALAEGRATASGERSDLSPHLPLLG
jgi:uncharacterized protein (TIGR03083 family)